MLKEEAIQEFIEELTENSIKEIEKDNGVNQPFLIFFLKDVNTEKYGQGVAPLPNKIMDTQEGKDSIVNLIIPTIKQKIKEDGHELICICFLSEIWRYEMPKDYKPNPSIDYRKIGIKTEAVMMAFHIENKSINYIFPMVRIADKLKLGKAEVSVSEYDKDVEGRFSKLF